ncbi:MAG: HAMP domain-containing histidine kinase [Rikenellaceae bacterium]|nr:HAMP domain-containing histidine kinase [Rikenellaceae bacterium]
MKLPEIARVVWNVMRNRTFVTVVWIALCLFSLVVSSVLVRTLREKETYYVSMWSYAMGRLGVFDDEDPLVMEIIKSNTIPFVITDDRLQVEYYHLVPDAVIDNPRLLRERLDENASLNAPIVINSWDGGRHYVFYGESLILRALKYMPLVQLVLFFLLMLLGFYTYRVSSDSSQNRVWVGLAKETAHQLGTPISSLLGWIEYLRSQPIDQSVVDEMNKDVHHLQKITDRFSKIGSQTELSPVNINELIGDCVLYFRNRIPRNVSLEYNGLAMAPVQAMANSALFEWVIENLLKNSLDALQGKGQISVAVSTTDKWINIDVKDTGKGMPKSNFKKIFNPGFTTKTRGWGLGLSLSRRIVEEYHKGRIFVLESEVGRGTTFRIQLKRLYL